MKHIRYSVHDNGIGEVIFDHSELEVNLLSSEVLLELENLLESIARQKEVKILLFKSAKKDIFIAGADIKEIKTLDTRVKALEKVRQGRDILSTIAALEVPTLAVIDGVALGGGFELALACDFRLTTENPKTKIGLPEVSLGVMPGFGGTVRLRNLIGLQKALELILGSKQLNGKKAEHLGLVDSCVPSGYLGFKETQMIADILDAKKRTKIIAKRHKATLLEKFAPSLIFSFAEKEVLKKTKRHYPAPLAVIEHYRKIAKTGFYEALEAETQRFATLALTKESKHLIELFFTSEALKHDTGVDHLPALKAINRASVFGGGTMGSGITWLFSKIDMPVRLKVRRSEQIADTLHAVNKSYMAIKRRKRLTQREIDLKMDRISADTRMRGFEKSDIAVEAIVEDMAAKQELYATLEETLRKDAIIATNTSSLSVSKLAVSMRHPERFVGMHFFNPVDRMPLVEVIRGDKTADETAATVVALAKRAGKTPIIVGDCPGFLVNRLLIPYIIEAIHLFEEGESFEKIDRVLLAFGMPMGPFRLADEVGLDVGYKVAKILEEGYGERIRCAPVFERIYSDLGLLGKKNGAGFYTYRGHKTVPNTSVMDLVQAKRSFSEDEIIDRTLLVMVNEASRALEEGIVKNASYLDMAMVMGTGFPPFRGGLLAYADERGIHDVVAKLNNLANAYGERFKPSGLLTAMAREKRTFYEE
ncbi:3-hydroxyacyl-CoA dehydrogenase NAD-binding domain-containing protein [Sulfurimonas sp. HSL3-7]|uniref:3-hydroxyacyl-CoA dehydrogenase NAD-binding domain-containing protein n=1 Tax=Sulfonitrofixus jiaomeiensis TaxID=3131938 RepID=UPI0031FA1D84